MKEHVLNDTEQVRMDAINLADHLTEYGDSGDNETANDLFYELICHFVDNGFLENDGTEYTKFSINRFEFSGLADPSLYTMPPLIFVYFLLKYCFADVIFSHGRLKLDFYEWTLVVNKLIYVMDYSTISSSWQSGGF